MTPSRRDERSRTASSKLHRPRAHRPRVAPTRPSRRMPLQRTIRLQQAVRDRQLSDCRFCLANPDLTTRYAYLAPDVPEGYGLVAIGRLRGSNAGNFSDFFVPADDLRSRGDWHATFY